MKILSLSLKNFGSYEELDLNFNDGGLILIQGATGSGKSTLIDAIPWILYGRTAKGGLADEILPWSGGVTTGTLELGGNLSITRTRGPYPKDNDLYFTKLGGHTFASNGPQRGANINDTQKLINQLLGRDIDLYLAGAYLHEFSQTSQFFTTTAKNRRYTTEQLVDLSLPKLLHEKIKDKISRTEESLTESNASISSAKYMIRELETRQSAENTRFETWNKNKQQRLAFASSKVTQFEETRKDRLQRAAKEADRKSKEILCRECGSVKAKGVYDEQSLRHELSRIETEENPYVLQEFDIVNETNPYTAGIKDYSQGISDFKSKLSRSEQEYVSAQRSMSDLETLRDIIADFRGVLIKNTVLDLESKTNQLLHNHFDSEIQIQLTIADADKLDIEITKDGNIAAYTQLSKGQRQMLKLCFGVSVMKCVANHHGIDFEQIFLDEVLSGLDENFKAKAFGMLSQLALEYKSIFVVDHSEGFKTLFNTQYNVELINGHSQLTKV